MLLFIVFIVFIIIEFLLLGGIILLFSHFTALPPSSLPVAVPGPSVCFSHKQARQIKGLPASLSSPACRHFHTGMQNGQEEGRKI